MITEFKSSAKRRKREHQQEQNARRHSWAGRAFFCNSNFSEFIQGGIINTSLLTLLKQRRSTINIQKKTHHQLDMSTTI